MISKNGANVPNCLILIMRHGGLDGVALQMQEYLRVLNEIGLHTHILSGRKETQFGGHTANGLYDTVIDTLDFYHPDSQLLFANGFTHGPETSGVESISQAEWMRIFARHKSSIQEAIEDKLQQLPAQFPILIYNLLSLRHAQPAAAVAIKELIEKYSDRVFISHAADPDAERPEKTSRMKDFALKAISANDPAMSYSGGPYSFPNLYHIVINPTQRDNFVNKHSIPKDHVFMIHDFLEFESSEPAIAEAQTPEFVDYLARNTLSPNGKMHRYTANQLTEDTVYFLSPVRPVYRKRLKEAMVVAHEYGRSRGKKVAFVVTHPNIDDKQYFAESVVFASQLGIQYIHLGEKFTIDTLSYVYKNMAALPSVGIVASSAGAWENALNEMAHACIPFIMSETLNSYKPLTQDLSIATYGFNFDPVLNLAIAE
ncbi:MAG: hypothetical protein ACE5I1_22185, partial [bacterium]